MSNSSNTDEIDRVLSAYASYTHVPRGLETSAEMSLPQAHKAIKDLLVKARIDSLNTAHRANGEHEFDNETDTYIDDMVEELEHQLTKNGDSL